jgi:hypothetical protein
LKYDAKSYQGSIMRFFLVKFIILDMVYTEMHNEMDIQGKNEFYYGFG